MRGAAAMRASGVLLLAALLGAASALDAPRSALKAATNTLVTSAQATAASDDTAQLLVSPEGEADRVTSLPGQPAPDVIDGAMPHNLLFTGYVTVDEAAGRALFYAFQTSGAGAKHPLVLWLNGGPGCSSLGGGFLSELGPHFPNADGTLTKNPWAWTKYANIIFLESPAFVGFSYSNSSADKVVGDARTASDSRAFLLGFLKKFPGFAASELYIAGESYAGHYVPQLAAAILDGNAAAAAAGTSVGALNLQGILVGNAWTDAPTDNYGAAFHWWSHYHISGATLDAMSSACNFSQVGPIRAAGRAHARIRDGLGPLDASSSRSSTSRVADDCEAACDQAMSEMGPLNIYQLFADVCPGTGVARSDATQLARKLAEIDAPPPPTTTAAAASLPAAEAVPTSLAARMLERAKRVIAYWTASAPSPASAAAPEYSSGESSDGSGFPSEAPCIDDFVTEYLNRPDVRAAMHVHPNAGTWSVCTDAIRYSMDDLLSSMLPLYPKLIGAGLRVWVYSGDVDGIVPTSGTRAWVEGLQLAQHAGWRPWLASDGTRLGPQVGGYVVEYEGLTFATVRGAGHMVPYTQPVRAAHLFKTFIAGAKL